MPPWLLIATRFGIGIRDPAWFDHRLHLLSSVTAPSLLAQKDQSFEWALFVGPELPAGVHAALDEILAPFEGRAFVDTKGHNSSNLLALAEGRELVNGRGYVLIGRIDDDDAWDRRTTKVVRERVSSWLSDPRGFSGYGLTFEDGLVWIMYDMIDIDGVEKQGRKITRPAAVRPYKYAFTSISGFVCSKLDEGLTPISAGHAQIPQLLARKNFAIDVVATEEPMWLYCRHKQTTSPIHRAGKAANLDLSLSDLSDRFGLDEARTESYISNAKKYGYVKLLRHMGRRVELRTTLKEVRQKLHSPETDKDQLVQLKEERLRLMKELSGLIDSLVADPDQHS